MNKEQILKKVLEDPKFNDYWEQEVVKNINTSSLKSQRDNKYLIALAEVFEDRSFNEKKAINTITNTLDLK